MVKDHQMPGSLPGAIQIQNFQFDDDALRPAGIGQMAIKSVRPRS